MALRIGNVVAHKFDGSKRTCIFYSAAYDADSSFTIPRRSGMNNLMKLYNVRMFVYCIYLVSAIPSQCRLKIQRRYHFWAFPHVLSKSHCPSKHVFFFMRQRHCRSGGALQTVLRAFGSSDRSLRVMFQPTYTSYLEVCCVSLF